MNNHSEDEAPQADPIEEVIRRCLRSQEQQKVIIENLLRNKTLQQIADQLGKKSGAVRVLKHRALEGLRNCEDMQKQMNESQNKDQTPPASDESNAVKFLRQAIAGGADQEITCAIAEQWLPSFVEDELAGEDVAAQYADIKRHLDLCAHCERVYMGLIELAQAEQTGALASTAAIPQPDLSFLPPRPTVVALSRELVSGAAEGLLRALTPQALPDLADLSDLFFERLELLGGALPASRGAATLGPEQDPSDAILTALSVAYRTTQQVAASHSAQELQTLVAQNQLHDMLQQAALVVALESGFAPADAQVFAQTYAHAARQQPDVWLELARSAQS